MSDYYDIETLKQMLAVLSGIAVIFFGAALVSWDPDRIWKIWAKNTVAAALAVAGFALFIAALNAFPGAPE